MKHTTLQSLFTAAFLFSISTSAQPQAHISALTKLRIAQTLRSNRMKTDATEEQSKYLPMIIQYHPDSDALERLRSLGTIIFNTRRDLALISIPSENIDEALAIDGILHGSASGDMSTALDKARLWGNVDGMQSGETPQRCSYTGKDVVVGISDIGFDPRHPAFSGGNLKAIYHTDASDGSERSALTTAEFEQWQGDTKEEYHATHVAGILAGGMVEGSPYQGIAPGADLVVATSDLSDVGILHGVEQIIAYAKEHSRPAVINVSMGNYLGPHDGTSLVSRYFSLCTADAPILLSAGNEGATVGGAYHKFSSEAPEATIRLNNSNTWTGFEIDGYVDLWSADATPFSTSIGIYDSYTGEIVWRSQIFETSASGSLSYDFSGMEEVRNWFSNLSVEFADQIWINDRFNATLHVRSNTETAYPGKEWARYFPIIIVKGDKGKSVDCFADAVNVFFQSVRGSATRLTTDMSISDMCTGPGVIGVGASTSRNEAPNFYDPASPLRWSNITDGTISYYSSYADHPLIPARPQISAPGSQIVAPFPTEYVQAHEQSIRPSLVLETTGSKAYWVAEQGTSMASPFAAGVFALWLQADPSLSPAELLDVAVSTADKDHPGYSSSRWGAGSIDAMAGLRKILDNTGITEPIETAEDSASLQIWSIDGRLLPVDAQLKPGIYLIGSPHNGFRKIAVH